MLFIIYHFIDYNSKHVSDDARNGNNYKVVRDGKFEDIRSGDIRVGDLIKVMENQMIPCDIVMLGSAHAKGHCFIDKANLNGETALEVVQSLPQTKCLVQNDADVCNLSLSISYEQPNKHFDNFRGLLSLPDNTDLNMSGKTLLMRETNLKNCPYIYGITVYTGNDTKIQRSNMDGEKAQIKKSHVMKLVDSYLWGMIILQIAYCFIGGLICGIWYSTANGFWYLSLSGINSAEMGVYAFFTWFIIMASMVPISLIVSGEMVKFVMSMFIEWDISMYYAPIDKRAKVNNSTIHEELGLIDYVFSDKTGTLTQNRMEFRFIMLPDGEFGSRVTEIARAVAKRTEALRNVGATPKAESKKTWTQMTRLIDNKTGNIMEPMKVEDMTCCYCCGQKCYNTCWYDPLAYNTELAAEESEAAANCFTADERSFLLKSLWGPSRPNEQEKQMNERKNRLYRCMMHMALSGTVKPFDDEGVLKFQAESAEELAMCQFAQKLGFTKRSQNPTVLEVEQYDKDLRPIGLITKKYNHLATFGFTSQRARVTVIYQDIATDDIHVMIKGQDTMTMPLLKKGLPDEIRLLAELDNMSTNGLRSLICGFSDLPASWWRQFSEEYQEVIQLEPSKHSEGHSALKCSRAPQCEKCRQHEFFNKVEESAELCYMGCIGLEDQLQLLVPETIADCMKAGIKVWMITGDKLAAAKNIGLACNLIDADMPANLSENMSPDAALEALDKARLVEVTGVWAENITDDRLEAMFDVFDTNKNMFIEAKELEFLLTSLRFRNLGRSFDEEFKSLSNGSGRVDKAGFVQLMKKMKVSKYDSIRSDVDEGLKKYQSITDHETYPISTLVNRDAFLVMFPGKRDPKQPAASGEPSEEELEDLRKKFFLLASVSKSVVFARAEPAMKKRMVTEIQARVPSAITLAIGDGANDTDMITAAHVGVGIAGVEGTAAVNSADYAIGTFRFLHTLLFVHGFWSYQRISKLVVFIFYKACLVAITMYYFGIFSGFSGTQFFNDPIYEVYNVIFTSMPIIFTAVLDQTLPRKILENAPLCYSFAKNKAFTSSIFFWWIVRALAHGAACYFIPMFAIEWNNNTPDMKASMPGLWFYSTVSYFAVALLPNILIFFEMSTVTLLHIIMISLTIVGIFLLCWIANITLSFNPDLYYVVNQMYESPCAWLTLVLTITVPVLIECVIRFYSVMFDPSEIQVLREKYERIQEKVEEIVKTKDPSADEVKEEFTKEDGVMYNEMAELQNVQLKKMSGSINATAALQIKTANQDVDKKVQNKMADALMHSLLKFYVSFLVVALSPILFYVCGLK